VGVPRDRLPPVASDEIYQADLVGLDVVNRAGARLGRVKDIWDFGAHPVLDVEHEEGRHRLIPFVPAYVDGVDLAAKRIDVDWEADY
jgi:16S rRNA processing protein RimM